ncbi:BMP family ABC transporter substrate-binding protein [Rubrimonas cliftonensis]|uniref:Nucleoside-binding protein n=1 Tax=Rubrimonas cliftonensis TaxID=89524 RepID=A0A1H3YFF5_9RHOB|nr:BMP family ABC transporter substrate-binding protein [Rubrimonas cliftonensis]SEA09744.1 nucleoside-binding protein [Rubrimonas cliftonensis]
MRRTLAALAVGLVATSAAAQELKVGFVYVGPIGDFGWTYQHDQGRLAVEQAFGDRVETTYVESVPEGADAERVIRQLAASGHGLIFTTSFGYMDATAKIAEQFPDVKFEHATGYKTAANLAIYNARFYEGRAVIGTIAGRMTRTNRIGYIASFPIPEVIMGVNAATLAAQKVNPDVEMTVTWVNSWYDPGREADAAKALIAQGIDVIMQHTDSPAPVQAAAEAGALAFGQASDMRRFGPEAHMTAIIDDWAPYYVKRVGQVLDGTWESTNSWAGFAEGEVVMAPYWNMPYEVAVEAADLERAIRLGRTHPFEGPVVDRDGAVQVPEGETASDAHLLSMGYFVQGVVGDLPK